MTSISIALYSLLGSAIAQIVVGDVVLTRLNNQLKAGPMITAISFMAGMISCLIIFRLDPIFDFVGYLAPIALSIHCYCYGEYLKKRLK